MRMKEERLHKKASKGYIERRRLGRRPRGRWIDVVDRDAKWMLKYKNWRWEAEDRKVWRRSYLKIAENS
jgi:hypothetical protein